MDFEGSTASLLILQDNAKKIDIVTLKKSDNTIGRFSSKQDDSQRPDIALTSQFVSRDHGCIFDKGGRWYYQDRGSQNGIFIDGRRTAHDTHAYRLKNGTILYIGGDASFMKMYKGEGVLMIFLLGDYSNQQWERVALHGLLDRGEVTVGRAPSCDIVLDSFSVAQVQGIFRRQNGGIVYRNTAKKHPALLDHHPVRNDVVLKDNDVLVLGRVTLIYTSGLLIYLAPQSGEKLTVHELCRVVQVRDPRQSGFHKKEKTILDHVNVEFTSSELVAVLGTSGAGKSTFVNCVIGYEKATGGTVEINGQDFNTSAEKSLIGYVPQMDLIRPNLTVMKTLEYVAALRLNGDVTQQERRQKIEACLGALDITSAKWGSRIRELSGGERKRVSIASELISDPKLLFLDEPTSGLDPKTEKLLVLALQNLAHRHGKTLIVITHTLKNIEAFDKILFMGPGGRACFYGSPDQALAFFDVTDLVDAYDKVEKNVETYARYYRSQYFRER